MSEITIGYQNLELKEQIDTTNFTISLIEDSFKENFEFFQSKHSIIFKEIKINISRYKYEIDAVKQNQQKYYVQLQQNLKEAVSFLKTQNLDKLTGISYESDDLMFSPIDEIFELLSSTQNITYLIFMSDQPLSSSHYETFLERIDQLKDLQQLTTNFPLKNGEVKEFKKSQFQHLNHFDMGTLTNHIQSSLILKSFGFLQTLVVKLDNIEDKDIDSFFSIIAKSNPLLSSLKVEIHQQINNTEMCLQHLEKVKTLQILDLKILNNALSKEYLNLQNLPNLNNLTLACKEPLNYLLSMEKIAISQVCLINSGISKNKIDAERADFLIDKFTYQFSCPQKQHITYIVKELEIIKSMAGSLSSLTIDFSKFTLFSVEEFDKKIISSLGNLFKECPEDLRIHLETKGCQFSKQIRLMLGWEFRHIKGLSKFTLNEINLQAEVEKYGATNIISLYNVDKTKAPYILMRLNAANLCFNRLVVINGIDYLEISRAEIKKNEQLKEIFEGIVNLKLVISHYYYPHIIPLLNSFCSKYIIYLDLTSIRIGLEDINAIVNSFDSLQTVSIEVRHLAWFFSEQQNTVPNKEIQIKLSIIKNYPFCEDIERCFNLKRHFFYINIEYGDQLWEERLTEIINENIDNNNKYIQIGTAGHNNKKECAVINEMYNKIYSEKVKISLFNQLIVQFMLVNPNMIYYDLIVD